MERLDEIITFNQGTWYVLYKNKIDALNKFIDNKVSYDDVYCDDVINLLRHVDINLSTEDLLDIFNEVNKKYKINIDTMTKNEITYFFNEVIVKIEKYSIQAIIAKKYCNDIIYEHSEFLNEIAVRYSKRKNRIGLVLPAPNGYTIRSYDINSRKIDNLNDYYDEQLIKKTFDFFSNNNRGGLILFHGEPGTGKTEFIRQISNKFGKGNESVYYFIFLQNSLLNGNTLINLIEPITYLNNVKPVIILEDSEELLKPREGSFTNVDLLLNLTDGLLTDILDVTIICTFNCELNKIDRALLRGGRLKMIHEFKKLPVDKIKKLSAIHNLNIAPTEPMTLSEIFMGNSISLRQNNRIGF